MHIECQTINDDGKCCCIDEVIEEDDDNDREQFGNWRRGRRDATLRDQQSTGRKRAAQLFPLNREGKCEWAGLKNAGGGRYPIVGCRAGLQQARHHGPDKNTLNNDEGNVHRICHTCHNRWHARNDNDYVPDEITNKHDPTTVASDEDYLDAELYFANHTPRKVGKD